jgi:hypothetical protein
MPKGKRVKRPKPQQSRGQQNPIGIVNKQRSTGAPGSGTKGHQKNPGSGTKRQGVSTGVGVTKAAEAAPKPTKTKAAEPSKTKKVKPAEAEGRYTITKQSAAHTRMKNVTGGTQTQQTQSKGRYRGRGVVGRR